MEERALLLIDEEERILRVWTPVLLRTILMVAVTLLLLALAQTFRRSHGNYAESLRWIQQTAPEAQKSLPYLAVGACHGSPTAIATLGLMVLTLVPLVRVSFCLLLFLRQRNREFVIFTSYVLAGLAIGVILGKIG